MFNLIQVDSYQKTLDVSPNKKQKDEECSTSLCYSGAENETVDCLQADECEDDTE